MYDFNGYAFPKASPTGRRIVVAYGSNPLTNGNGTKVAGGTPGNHTPQDVLAYADDNVGGTFASRITGHGLLDNTDLTPIMSSFLNVTLSNEVTHPDPSVAGLGQNGLSFVYPNPASTDTPVTVAFKVEHAGNFSVEIYNAIGQRVRTLYSGNLTEGSKTFTWDGKDDIGARISPGMYVLNVAGAKEPVTNKFIVK